MVRILAIAGGSCSGKTTLAKQVVERLGEERAAYLAQDSYYRPLSGSVAERARVNFDHPDALDFALMADQLAELKVGRAVETPVYDFATHARQAKTARLEPKPVIVVDGILILHAPELGPMLDLACFLECPEDLRLERRIARDVAERSRSEASVRAQFAATVAPMHEEFVEPSKANADIIVDQARYLADTDRLIDQLLSAL